MECPPIFSTQKEAYFMNREAAENRKSRNEFRELALASALMLLLIVTLI